MGPGCQSNGLLSKITVNEYNEAISKNDTTLTQTFFDRTTSTKDKGRHRVKDVRKFDTNSLRRIIVNSSSDSESNDDNVCGVSLLVGKRMDTKAVDALAEEVITVVFDTKVFDEDAAHKWWSMNKHKYL